MKIVGTCLILALAILTACSGSAPVAQKTMCSEYKKLESKYSSAKRTGNAFEVKQVAGEVAELEANYQGRQIQGWIGRVVEVSNFLNHPAVEVKYKHMTFHLRNSENGWKSTEEPVYHELSRGDKVEFDGTLLSEISVTTKGSLDEPEWSVQIESLRK